MPSKQFMAAYADPSEGEASSPNARSHRMGFEEGMTWGVLSNIPWFDEISAKVDSFVLGWDYDERLAHYRSKDDQAWEDQSLAYGAGVITGGLAPGLKLLNITGKGVKGAALSGAAYGALYGSGEADEGGFENRLKGALTGAAFGLGGGYLIAGVLAPRIENGVERLAGLLKRGESPVLDAAKLPSAALAGRLDETLDGSILDGLEEGALVTARELLGEPAAAAKAIDNRLGRMTPPQAERLLRSIVKAETDGNVLDNPHFRSLLKVDLSGERITADQMVRAAEIFEDAVEKLAAKAGTGTRTVKGMDRQVSNELRKGLTMAELERDFAESQNGFVNTRKAQHVMVSAAAKLVRLREDFMPKLVAGEEGARERLAEELTDVAHRFILARGILSNAGRSLGILSHGVKARMVDAVEDVDELGAGEIRLRVDAAVSKLGDNGLKDLLTRVRTMADAEQFGKVLLNGAEAETFTSWQRTVGSVKLFLRSNALTPATFAWNAVGMVLNAGFRSELARRKAVSNLEKAGRLDEALMLRLEQQAIRAVRWRAHRDGMKALLKRVQWEFWGDVERIAAVGYGKGGVAAKAALRRDTMLADGYSPPTHREDFSDRPRLNVIPAEFNARNEARRVGGGALGNIVYHLEKARAVAANTLDAAGGASMKLFTAAPDDWGREFVRVTETFAQSTRFAFNEAKALGLVGEELVAHVERRARELAEMPTSEMMEKVEEALLRSDELGGEAGFFVDLQKRIEDEADRTLFMDGPQTVGGRASERLLSWVDQLGIVLPYIRTPLRIMENALVNYGPFNRLSAEVAEIMRRGGVEAELEKARVEVGMQVFGFGVAAGLGGIITATNGGFENSANLDAGPPNRLNLPGGGFIEIGRLDPFSMTVGLGAMVGQALREGWKTGSEYEVGEVFSAVAAVAHYGTRDVILDKSYLKGLQDILDIPSEGPERALAKTEQILQNAAARFVPMGGVGRQINDTFRTSAIESIGWADALLRTIPGAGYGMAPKIDPLGDEVKSRNLGIQFGNSELTEGEPISDVKRKLRDLGINITTIRKADPEGFELTAEELSEVRRIRAKEAYNAEGLTMHEALGELFDDPWFQALPTKDQKRDAIVDVMREFNKPAWDLLMERSPSYAAKKTYRNSLANYIAEGMARDDAEREAQIDLESAGLPAPDL